MSCLFIVKFIKNKFEKKSWYSWQEFSLISISDAVSTFLIKLFICSWIAVQVFAWKCFVCSTNTHHLNWFAIMLGWCVKRALNNNSKVCIYSLEMEVKRMQVMTLCIISTVFSMRSSQVKTKKTERERERERAKLRKREVIRPTQEKKTQHWNILESTAESANSITMPLCNSAPRVVVGRKNMHSFLFVCINSAVEKHRQSQ